MDPRNTAATEPADLEWSEPSSEETGRFRRVIDVHRTDPREYRRLAQGEVIDVETDRFGCTVTTDRTDQFPVITLECQTDLLGRPPRRGVAEPSGKQRSAARRCIAQLSSAKLSPAQRS